ncbi:MAG: RsmB/NOP family class I SAM-dependent RNA methyltransferase [Bacteriovoracaceae bacterium]|nr:RsmB/NOP family class I SAM-dependent RNA methyltransferase [Bacteriovoracaceae bacterium]
MSKFFDFFENYYGSRWKNLFTALKEEDQKVLREVFPSDHTWDNLTPFKLLSGCYLPNEDLDYTKEVDADNLRHFYYMDPGSIIAARSLEVQEGETVLDMCSAPGGKGLILTEALMGNGHIDLNEPSRNRRERLKKVVRDHVPDELRNVVSVKGQDGLNFGLKFKDTYDKILVDAPCSGERHLIHRPSELSKWTPKRSKRLASRQYGLLCSALLSVKPRGTIIYSTCSISPLENDGVLEKLKLKKSDSFEVVELEGEMIDKADKTKFGRLFLPDTSGYGPLYIAKIRKV